jgi:hypothetical protein
MRERKRDNLTVEDRLLGTGGEGARERRDEGGGARGQTSPMHNMHAWECIVKPLICIINIC